MRSQAMRRSQKRSDGEGQTGEIAGVCVHFGNQALVSEVVKGIVARRDVGQGCAKVSDGIGLGSGPDECDRPLELINAIPVYVRTHAQGFLISVRDLAMLQLLDRIERVLEFFLRQLRCSDRQVWSSRAAALWDRLKGCHAEIEVDSFGSGLPARLFDDARCVGGGEEVLVKEKKDEDGEEKARVSHVCGLLYRSFAVVYISSLVRHLYGSVWQKPHVSWGNAVSLLPCSN
ncbi:hypothetical protein HPP92_003927 [Vanilla planifolia]|uniref:Uncharacterized protein n=1 Tax=Vanilla planifolia TaxID=51239 RepID=A0A835S466_VANPL|nr:hypothetical protein HPP92_004342 [Vanilla planifolia]KAG0503855.1 hypothetical protein HPP92_003927 [Vanilla planifolia]